MRRVISFLLVMLSCAPTYAQERLDSDLYWISHMTYAPNRGFYHMLMQIDQAGRITVPPVRVAYIRQQWNESAIFIDDFGRLNLWTFYNRRGLYRYILDVNPKYPAATAIRRLKTNIKSNVPFTWLSSTQKLYNNFLTITRWNNQYYAHILGLRIGAAGEPVYKPWEIDSPFLSWKL